MCSLALRFHTFTLKSLALTALIATSLSILAQPSHPLDPISGEEIKQTVDLLRGADLVDDASRFALITLYEPEKADVKGWASGQPMPRAAYAIVRHEGKTFEAEVDLTRAQILDWREAENAEAGILLEEIIGSTELVASNAEFQQALAKRGIEDFSQVYCPPLTASYFGIEEEEGKRLLKTPCFDLRGTYNPYAKPIEGLYAVVDLNRREVVEVIDEGVVPIPEGAAQFDEDSVGEVRQKLYPIVQKQERQANYAIDGHWISWQNWRFHLRVDRRTGPVISEVSYQDGERKRSVLYQAHLSEIYVPYMDTSSGWFWKTFMDAGEYGYGLLASPIVPGVDCPEHASLLGATFADDFGAAYDLTNILAVFEQNTGMSSWRHYELANGVYEGRPDVELVVRMISAIGNYDYQLDWVFRLDGSIRVDVTATGIDAVKAVAARHMDDPTAAADTAYGTLLDPNVVAPNHDHWFIFRLDMDVDGQNNSLALQRLTEVQPEESPRQSIWTTQTRIPDSEMEARMKFNPATPTLWRVINPEAKNHVGNPVSYHLAPMNSGHHDVLNPQSYAGTKGGFTQFNLWTTPYRRDEIYAAGVFVNQKSAPDGVDAWTKADRPVENTDIVLWYNMGFHHVPRSEDWPVAPAMKRSFVLRPFNFFDRNPAIDTPTDFRRTFPQFKTKPN